MDEKDAKAAVSEYTVTEALDGERLDRAAAQLASGLSRARLKRAIDAGGREAVREIWLKAARAVCDFYIRETPTCGVPYWDTGAPGLTADASVTFVKNERGTIRLIGTSG